MGIEKNMTTGITEIAAVTLTEDEEKKLKKQRRGCRGCSLPCGKMKTNWWSPSQIRWCGKQVQFLLANYGSQWPPKPSGYFDTHEDVQKSVSDNVTWEEIIFVRSNLELRIVKMPELVQNLIFDRRISWDAEWWDMVDQDVDEAVKRRLLQAAHDVVNYLKGFQGKKQDFNQWKAGKDRDESHKKYGKENTQITTPSIRT